MSTPATPDIAGIVIEEATDATPELVKAFESFRDRLGRTSVHYSPSAEDLDAIIQSSTTRLLVAKDEDGQVRGALTLVIYRLPSGMRSWIEDVVVRSHDTGKGLGAMLVTDALRRAKENGATSIELLVDPSQIAARNLFQSMGLRPYDKSPYSMKL